MKKPFFLKSKGIVLIMLCLFVSTVYAQNITVKGTVVDADNISIIGATVVVKNAPSQGAATDLEGKYAISNVAPDAVLVVSYVGMKTQEIPVNGRNVINIVMKNDSELLDEVVVVGYATQKKVNVTGAVSMVDSKALESRPVQNITQALQGQVPGLSMSVGNGGGALNASLGVSIRGGGTIGSGSSGNPLVLIDGIEGSMNTVNPNDVASISVLKDAASSSIYGARAAFGVILITTKSGKSGKTKFSYSGNTRFNTAIQRPKMMNSLEFANYFNEAQRNHAGTVLFKEEVIEKIKNFLDGKYTDPNTPEYYGTEVNPNNGKYKAYLDAFANTDWFQEFYKDNVPSHEHNINISGGNDMVTYMISGNILNQNGLLRHGKDRFKRFTLNSKFSAKLTDWVTMNVINKWTREDYSRPQYLEIGGLFYHNIARRWPTNPARVPGGHNMHWMEQDELEQGGVMRTNKNWITNQLQFVFEPVKDWHINVEGSLRQFSGKSHKDILPTFSYDANGEPFLVGVGWTSAGYSFASESTSAEDYYSVNLYSDYSKDVGDHYFKILGGMNTELYQARWLSGQGEELITALVPELSSAQKNFKTRNGKQELALAGFFGRLNYNYKERYLLEANLRYDGSSRYIDEKRWGLFPSFSVGWNIAREDFWKSYENVVNNLKLRASWGQLGNNEMRAYYPFYQSMPVGMENSRWIINGKKQNTAGLPGIVSDLLTWERVESWNVGLDFGALNNRLTGSFDVFNRYTYDMVGPAPTLPAILGAPVPKVNNADLKSYGWELELSWRDNIDDLSYGVRVNMSDTRRKILRYPNETGTLKDYYAEKQLGEIWGYTTEGIAQSQEQIDEWLENNNPNWGDKWTAGDIMYKDLNGDKIVNAGAYTLTDHGDLKVIGNSTPRYSYGINIDAAWKGIDFVLFLQGVLKRDYILHGPYFWGASGSEWQSAGFVEHADYWTESNRDAYYPRPLFKDTKNQRTQTRYLQDASYMRIKNIQFGYTIPLVWTSKIGLNKLRFYVSADNLATFTKISPMFDAEALGGDWGPGKLYPLQKSLSLGVNINF